MDLSQVIKDKLQELRRIHGEGSADGLDLVLRHLDVAEKHFQNARSQNDPELFTDVIYRTNQVFEGVLKEVYRALSSKDASKKTTNEIEKFLTDKEAFRPRVLDYFNRYRTGWRNPSTHDHRLDFDEHEAFLAYATVCGFCLAALNQTISHYASRAAIAAAPPHANKFTAESVANLMAERLPVLLEDFRATAPFTGELATAAVEGLIKGTWSQAEIAPPDNPINKLMLYPDINASDGKERVLVEIKHQNPLMEYMRLPEYLQENAKRQKATGGVVIMLPQRPPKAFSEPAFIVRKRLADPPIYVVELNREAKVER